MDLGFDSGFQSYIDKMLAAENKVWKIKLS